MTGLRGELRELAAAGDAVSVAIIGAGRMGRSMTIAAEEVDGVAVSVVADIELDRARESFGAAGHQKAAIASAETIDASDEELSEGNRVVTADALLPAELDGVDVIIGATGVAEIGAEVATRSILNGKHVVMLTDETDAVVGPYLSAMARNAGVVYSGAAGDEPGSIMELYDFAATLGFEVVAAGKGKNNPLDREATPEGLAEEAAAKDLNPEIYTAFVDGTNTMLEMTMVANATGLTVDRRGMHGPEVDGVPDLADALGSESNGGVLSERGVVEYALGGGVAPGVFLVVTTDNETVRKDLEYLGIGDGPNYCLHRAYHIPTIEPLLTAARVALSGEASLVPQEPAVDTVTVAKRDLSPGEEIDGIGGTTVYGLAERAEVAEERELVPISLVENATVRSEIAKGEDISYDDVGLKDSDLLHLRKLQDSYFRS
jgi:predicted homoserine dehydrogenase-like protein